MQADEIGETHAAMHLGCGAGDKGGDFGQMRLGQGRQQLALFLAVLHQNDLFAAVPHKYLVAFVGATGICSVFNFIGQKFWIFKEEPVGLGD